MELLLVHGLRTFYSFLHGVCTSHSTINRFIYFIKVFKLQLIVRYTIFTAGVICKQKGTPAVAAELRKNTNLEEVLVDVQTKLNISTENSFFDLSTSGLFTTVIGN